MILLRNDHPIVIGQNLVGKFLSFLSQNAVTYDIDNFFCFDIRLFS